MKIVYLFQNLVIFVIINQIIMTNLYKTTENINTNKQRSTSYVILKDSSIILIFYLFILLSCFFTMTYKKKS